MSANLNAGGYVYAIRTQGAEYVKIGVAKNVPSRMRELCTSSPHKLFIYATRFVDKPYELEKRLHQVLSDFRVRNSGGREWFMWCKETREMVRAHLRKELRCEHSVEDLKWQKWLTQHNEEAMRKDIEKNKRLHQEIDRLKELSSRSEEKSSELSEALLALMSKIGFALNSGRSPEIVELAVRRALKDCADFLAAESLLHSSRTDHRRGGMHWFECFCRTLKAAA